MKLFAIIAFHLFMQVIAVPLLLNGKLPNKTSKRTLGRRNDSKTHNNNKAVRIHHHHHHHNLKLIIHGASESDKVKFKSTTAKSIPLTTQKIHKRISSSSATIREKKNKSFFDFLIPEDAIPEAHNYSIRGRRAGRIPRKHKHRKQYNKDAIFLDLPDKKNRYLKTSSTTSRSVPLTTTKHAKTIFTTSAPSDSTTIQPNVNKTYIDLQYLRVKGPTIRTTTPSRPEKSSSSSSSETESTASLEFETSTENEIDSTKATNIEEISSTTTTETSINPWRVYINLEGDDYSDDFTTLSNSLSDFPTTTISSEFISTTVPSEFTSTTAPSKFTSTTSIPISTSTAESQVINPKKIFIDLSRDEDYYDDLPTSTIIISTETERTNSYSIKESSTTSASLNDIFSSTSTSMLTFSSSTKKNTDESLYFSTTTQKSLNPPKVFIDLLGDDDYYDDNDDNHSFTTTTEPIKTPTKSSKIKERTTSISIESTTKFPQDTIPSTTLNSEKEKNGQKSSTTFSSIGPTVIPLDDSTEIDTTTEENKYYLTTSKSAIIITTTDMTLSASSSSTTINPLPLSSTMKYPSTTTKTSAIKVTTTDYPIEIYYDSLEPDFIEDPYFLDDYREYTLRRALSFSRCCL